MNVVGLLLAAGDGTRLGRTKALVTDPQGASWVVTTARMMLAAGCERVFVAVGADRSAVHAALDLPSIVPVDVPDWSAGLGASLATGIRAVAETDADCCVIHLVDLPDVTRSVVKRVIAAVETDHLARATFSGAPGHPVAITRPHWAPMLDTVHGDTGAAPYLRRHQVTEVECSDLASGCDIDTPAELSTWEAEQSTVSERGRGSGRPHRATHPSSLDTDPQ